MTNGNGQPIGRKVGPLKRTRSRGGACSRTTKFQPLVEPRLDLGKRAAVARQLVERLCEQLFLGGSLTGWQVGNMLAAVTAIWERYPRDETKLERLLAHRYERDHVVTCPACKGCGTVALQTTPSTDKR